MAVCKLQKSRILAEIIKSLLLPKVGSNSFLIVQLRTSLLLTIYYFTTNRFILFKAGISV